jgi:hypothetical protein
MMSEPSMFKLTHLDFISILIQIIIFKTIKLNVS